MNTYRLILLLTVVSCAMVETYGNTFEFDYVTSTPGFSGQLILDTDTSPSGGGTVADIVSGSITTPTYGTLPIDLATA
jgi:hypothetical protein